MTQSIPQLPDSRESKMVTIKRDETGNPTVWCDPEIADLVKALNDGGIATIASCSGHGRAGVISLADGRELIIAKDFAEARRIEAAPPTVVNGWPDLNWREVAVWWEQGAKDWQDLKEIIPRMFNRAALPPPGRGMVPMTEGTINAVFDATRYDSGYGSRVDLVRALEAEYGIKEGS